MDTNQHKIIHAYISVVSSFLLFCSRISPESHLNYRGLSAPYPPLKTKFEPSIKRLELFLFRYFSIWFHFHPWVTVEKAAKKRKSLNSYCFRATPK